jgi:hypothetical protein
MIKQDQKNGGIRRRFWPTRGDKAVAADVSKQAQSIYDDILVGTFHHPQPEILTPSILDNNVTPSSQGKAGGT